jgi:outer membrane protein OmpA-like peptidoglycan-associated protein
MKSRALRAVPFLVALLVPPVAAQQTGLELGAFAQVSYWESSLHFDQGAGGGGVRIGFFPMGNLLLEGEGGFVPTEARSGVRVSYIPLRARLLFNFPAGEHSAVLLGGGYARNEFRRDIHTHEDGVTGLLGLRLGLPSHTSIRISTSLDYIPSPSIDLYPAPALEPDNNVNWNIQVGLGFLLGGSGYSNAPRERPAAVAPRPDTLQMQARRDSMAQARRQDSIRVAQAAQAEQNRLRDSVRVAAEKAQAQQRALRDSIRIVAQQDSAHAAALRDSLRLTRNRARMAEIRDSLERMALRDSLRLMMETRRTRLTLRGVNFELGKAVLLPISRDILEEVARSLVANPTVRVEVAGHTDSTGPRAVNERLSLARAESVKAFLVENGVAGDRMTVQGYASTQPVASNRTASGRAQNRRVELRRTD